jgi:hypothetical protein
MKSSAEGASSEEEVFKLWTGLRDLVQKHRSFREANWAMGEDHLGPIEKICKEIEPRDPVRQVLWLFNDYAPQGGMPKGQDYIEEANRDRADAVRELLDRHGIVAVLELAKAAKLPHFVGIAVAQATDSLELLKQILEGGLHPESSVNIDFAIALSICSCDGQTTIRPGISLRKSRPKLKGNTGSASGRLSRLLRMNYCLRSASIQKLDDSVQS